MWPRPLLPGPPGGGCGEGRLGDGRTSGRGEGAGPLDTGPSGLSLSTGLSFHPQSRPLPAQGVTSCLERGAGTSRGGGGAAAVTGIQGPSAAPASSMAPTAPEAGTAQARAPPCRPSRSPAPGQGSQPLCPAQVPLTEVVEPLDFEDVLLSRPPDAEPGPLRELVEFPADDLELLLRPRECRTTEPGIPEEGCVRAPPRPPLCPRSPGDTPLPITLPAVPTFSASLGCVTSDKAPSVSEAPSLHL